MKKNNKKCNDWTALYMPANLEKDPSRSGFKSREAAEHYASRFYCWTCRHERAVALNWKRKYGIDPYDAQKAVCKLLEKMATRDRSIERPDGLELDLRRFFGEFYGPCNCEWMFIPTEKANKCKSFQDVMKAVGAKKIWSK